MSLIAVKEAGKDLHIVNTNQKYRTAAIKEIVTSAELIEYMKLDGNVLAFGGDEEANIKKLEHNFFIKTNSIHFTVQRIAGTVVFCRTKYVDVWQNEIYDYELEDLTIEDLCKIESLFNTHYQSILTEEYEKQDNNKGFVIEEIKIDDLIKKFTDL